MKTTLLPLALLALLVLTASASACQPWFYAQRQHREMDTRRAEADAELARSTAEVADRLNAMDARLRADLALVTDSLSALGFRVDSIGLELLRHQATATDRLNELTLDVLDIEEASREALRQQDERALLLLARVEEIKAALDSLTRVRRGAASRAEQERLPEALQGLYVVAVGPLHETRAQADAVRERLDGLVT